MDVKALQLELMNSYLPPQVRVFELKRVGEGILLKQ